MERNRAGYVDFPQHIAHVILNFVQTVNFLVVSHEHVTIDLVDEHLVNDVLLHLTRLLD